MGSHCFYHSKENPGEQPTNAATFATVGSLNVGSFQEKSDQGRFNYISSHDMDMLSTVERGPV